MPRIARKHCQSCFYHVIVQGINKEYIFNKEEYIKKYKRIILEKLEDSKVKILGYCIMNNHAHFLIFTDNSEYMSKYMQRINTAYSNFYNKVQKRVGYVFRDRYYSQEIVCQKQLYNCLKYIHMNPVKANISKSVKEYKYSSYNEFLENMQIIDREGIRIIFGTEHDFKDKFYEIHNMNDDNEENEFFDIKEKEIGEFILEVERKYHKKVIEIRKDKETLRKIIKEARKQTNVTLAELAKILDVSKSTVGNYLKE